jgi:hypothetical protein
MLSTPWKMMKQGNENKTIILAHGVLNPRCRWYNARVVRTLQVPNAVKGQTFTFNTTDLKPGIYQLTIRRGEMIESKTIAVKL